MKALLAIAMLTLLTASTSGPVCAERTIEGQSWLCCWTPYGDCCGPVYYCPGPIMGCPCNC